MRNPLLFHPKSKEDIRREDLTRKDDKELTDPSPHTHMQTLAPEGTVKCKRHMHVRFVANRCRNSNTSSKAITDSVCMVQKLCAD